jgi:predicted GH43/DUF377 family glycosyl hydrolase
MKWNKQGLIYGPDGTSDWAKNSALQPTPLMIDEKTIRVFVGMRDEKGRSRVGFVDVSADNPNNVLRVSERPALNLGIVGSFDENGVVPCAVVKREDEIWLYYAGYQLGQQVRFYVFSGLAISRDGGETFARHQRVPICDRTNEELFFRVIHTIFHENGVWRIWYGAGSEYDVRDDGYQLPKYNIRYVESNDGIKFNGQSVIAVNTSSKEEYRIGRPYVIKRDNKYLMFYAADSKQSGYRLAYAESFDGIRWTRKDDEVGIDISTSGWDSEMMSYPSLVTTKTGTFLFYNGNRYGRDGFGYAALEQW